MSAGREGELSPAVGGTERALELVVAGLARDEDELLGNLAEGRAEVAGAHGERAAWRWWRGQVVRAVPRLMWHDLVHRPSMLLLGLAGFVLWVVVASIPSIASWFPVASQSYDVAHPVLPSVSRVITDTVVVGFWNLLAAAVVGAGMAALVRRARLAPVILAAALMALASTRHAFWIVYGPGTCTLSPDAMQDECSLELGAWSSDVVVPVLWQLPTMMVLLPLATVLGGLLVVAWSARGRHRRTASAPGPHAQVRGVVCRRRKGAGARGAPQQGGVS